MPAPQETAEFSSGFTPEQRQYLEKFLGNLAHIVPFVGIAPGGLLTATAAEAPQNLAEPVEATLFGKPLGDLTKQERWKFEENPLDIWEKLVAHAEDNRFPDEPDTFRFKFHGLFYVAPAQDSFMVRLRLPAGSWRPTRCMG